MADKILPPEDDHQLLKLAAKAAFPGGFEWNGVNQCIEYIPEGSVYYRKWRPLEDDGDAFRLMVALGADSIEIRFGCDNDCVQVETWANAYDEDFGQDPNAATRRAIVRAAAEIGRRKE